jgi:autotransporter translocation and assembly factor TamB
LKLDGVAGKLAANLQLNNITKTPSYTAELFAQDLDFHPILNDSLFSSDVQFEANINGAGFEFPKLNAEIDAQIFPSIFSGYQLDSLTLAAKFQKGDYWIKSLELNSPYLKAEANGAGNLESIQFADLQGELGDLADLQSLLNQDICATGHISAHGSGPFDSLATKLQLDLQDVEFGDYSIATLENKTNGVFKESKFTGQSNFIVGRGKIQNIKLDTLTLNLAIKHRSFDYDLDFTANDSVKTFLAAKTSIDSTIKTEIKNVVLEIGQQLWASEKKPAIIDYCKARICIQDLVLNSQAQVISINGFVEPAGEQNLQMTIKGLNVSPIQQFSGTALPWALGAYLDLDAFLFGTAKKPEIKTHILLQNLVVQNQQFPELKLVAEYKNENLTFQTNLKQKDGGLFNIKMDAPFHLSFIDSTRLFDKEKPVSATVDAADFDLAFLSVFTSFQDQINAKLDANLKAETVLPEPSISGNLTLQNGAYLLDEYGLDYKHIVLDVDITDEQLTINKLFAQAGDGHLNATGTANFIKGQYLKGPQEMDLQLKGQNLQVAKSRGVEMIVNSDISLNGNPDEIVFGGNVEVVRSKINIAELPGSQRGSSTLAKPRLVQAQQDSVIQLTNKLEQDSTSAQNLRGRITVKIPRNTWVRSEDMNIELSGDLELVKKGPFFEMFGSVQTVRGTYNLYGRRFNIREGVVTFQGGTEVNPVINLEAVYSFRNVQGDKTNLTLKTTGTLLEPKIAFKLNDVSIEEADGISYIVFGKSSNDLSRGEKSEVSQQGGSGAQLTAVLSGQVTGQLTKAIQQTFNLDVMEFRGGSNWRQASIVIGKYLTNDLYMAYEREFNVGKTQNVIPEKVSLEYEITPRIFIQATKGDDKSTGIDVIWKIEKK